MALESWTVAGNSDLFSKTVWILDSGATSHMTPHRSILSDLQPLKPPIRVAMGTGIVTNAHGRGTLKFRSGGFAGQLHSVLWVPELKENLFSLGRCIELGYDIKFANATKEVKLYLNNQLKLVGKTIGRNLFSLKLLPIDESREQNLEIALFGNSLTDWHRRFAHVGADAIRNLITKNAVTGLTVNNKTHSICEQCTEGKICRCPHPSRSTNLADENSAAVHLDTCGPFATASLGGSNYFITAVEEYSSYKLIEFVQSKSEIPNRVKLLINRVEVESRRPVKTIVSDNGTEFINRDLQQWLLAKGVSHLRSCVSTPEQNGSAERSIRTVIDGSRTLLHETNLPENLWAEAAGTIVYTTNRLLPNKDEHKTKFELYHGHKPDVSNLRQFGELAVVRIPKQKRKSKLQPSGKQMVFVGYTNRTNTFRFYDPERNTITIACDVRFINKMFFSTTKPKKPERFTLTLNPGNTISDPSNEVEFNTSSHLDDTNLSCADQNMSDTPADSTSSNTNLASPEKPGQDPSSDDYISDADQTDNDNSMSHSLDEYSSTDTLTTTNAESPGSQKSDEPARLTRAAKQTSGRSLFHHTSLLSWFWSRGSNDNHESALTAFTLEDEPRTIKEAQSRPDWDKWKSAMDEEISALNKNKTWLLTNKPSNARLIKSKWVFKLKLAPDGQVDRYKARLVAKGFSQVPGIDYKETFSPVASLNTIRMILALANQNRMEMRQFDVKTAFLYGDLNEVIHMEYPEGYANPDNKVCRLQKSIYGLKQAPRQWSQKFHKFLEEFQLKQSKADKCLYFNESRSLYLTIYVDDGLIAATETNLIIKLVSYLKEHLELKVMELESYLNLKIGRNHKNKTLHISQEHYIDRILDKFNMNDCKTVSTPEEVGQSSMSPTEHLTPDYPFKELVGCLLYLANCSRPDISHAVSIASRTSMPTTKEWAQLKRVLRYLKGTKSYGLVFRWEKNPQLIGYSDADYANDLKTRRSTTGYFIMFGSTPIAWRCQRQAVVSLSTTEAEYISGCELVKELIPIRNAFLELNQISNKPTLVLIDNLSTVKIANNDSGQQRTKHIDVRHKWLNEQTEKGTIVVKHVPGDKQIADILTKPLLKTKFETNRNLLISSIMFLSMLTLATGYTFTKANPLLFRPTKYQYFKGDAEYKLTLKIMQPCHQYFTGFRDFLASNLDSTYEPVKTQCLADFKTKLYDTLGNCRVEDDSQNKTGLNRQKRIAPILILGYIVMCTLRSLELCIKSDF